MTDSLFAFDSPYEYFVSYAYSGGFGNVKIAMDFPISGTEELSLMHKELDKVVPRAVILYWCRFEKSDVEI